MSGTIARAIVVIAFGIALLTAVSIAAASAASHHHARPAHPQAAKRVHRYGPYGVAAPPSATNHRLPFRLDLTAVIAVGGCLLVLGSWGVWQTRRRCSTCGCCPAFCGCDELAQH